MTAASSFHRPVLVDEAIGFLVTSRNGAYVDATAGGGGHTHRIVTALDPGGRVLAIDRDADAVAAARKHIENSTVPTDVVQGEFAALHHLASEAGMSQVNGILFDLGVSSFQLDRPDRGFSYREAGPLDLRMNPFEGPSAADVIAAATGEELARMFFEYGEERNSRKIAAAIVDARRKKPITTTAELAAVISRVTNPRYLNKTFSRVFQALRIVVNEEIRQLERGLEGALELLTSGGRLVVISYHSLEDRLVKNFIRERSTGDTAVLRRLTKKPVVPSRQEIEANSRARSAKLRAAERI